MRNNENMRVYESISVFKMISEAYETLSRSESVTDLRVAAGGRTEAPQPHHKHKYEAKKCSLASLGLATLHHRTMFDTVEAEAGEDAGAFRDAAAALRKAEAGEDAGAFRDAAAALRKAVADLRSGDWRAEVTALSAVVRVAAWSPGALVPQLGTVLDLVTAELRSPRSQVAKVAAQTLTKLFSLLPHHVEREASFEAVVAALLLRTGDTNRFLRVDASDALDTMAEHVTVHGAVAALVAGGGASRSPGVRVGVAWLLLHLVRSLGAGQVLGGCRDTAATLLCSAAELLEDGSQDVR